MRGEPKAHDMREHPFGVRPGDDLAHLLPHAFGREVAEVFALRAQRRLALCIEGRVAGEAAVEAQEAQSAQTVLADPLGGVADEPDAAVAQVLQAVEGVVQPALEVDRHRVDAQIAPTGIGGPVGGPLAVRVATVVVALAPQGRDLVDTRGQHDADGAVLEPELQVAQPMAEGERDLLVGRRRGGEIEVLRRLPEQGVAHASADESDAVPFGHVEVGERLQVRRDLELHRGSALLEAERGKAGA